MKKIQFRTTVHHDDFIVHDHRVHGVRMMPGVTFLDLVWRLLTSKGLDPVAAEIIKVVFSHPVMMDENQSRCIKFDIETTTDQWRIVARSQLLSTGLPENEGWDENFRCSVNLNCRDLSLGRQIAKMPDSQATSELIPMESVYARARDVDIVHLERMTLVGDIHKFKSQAFAELMLSPQAILVEDDYVVHPAILDSATLVPFVFLDHTKILEPYIPLSIERVTLNAPVRGKIRVHVHDSHDTQGIHDVLFHNYDLCDLNNQVLVRVERLSAKRVRNRFSSERSSSSLVAKAQPDASGSKRKSVHVFDISDHSDTASNLRDWLTAHVSDMLGREITREDAEVGFYDLGLDSRQLLEFVRILEQGLGKDLYPTLLFEEGTIQRLSSYLLQEHPEGVQSLLKLSNQTDKTTDQSQTTLMFSESNTVESHSSDQIADQTIMLVPVFESQPIEVGSLVSSKLFIDIERMPELEQLEKSWPGSIAQTPGEAGIIFFGWRGAADAQRLFELCASITSEAMLVVVHPEGVRGYAEQSAVSGLLSSVSLERPMLRLISIAGANVKQLIEETNAARPGFRAVRYLGGQRLQRCFKQIPVPQNTWRTQGVWVITGGLGRLGLGFARALRAEGAKVGLVGRRSPSSALEQQLMQEETEWVVADVSDYASLALGLDVLRERLGPFTGVIHAAGVLRDGLVMSGVDPEAVHAVLTPKMTGAANLDALTRNDPLDIFLLCSSVSGSFGNLGQAVYAYANGLLDGFAQDRTGPGRTLSVGWPLWADGGMQVPEADAKAMRNRYGMQPMPTEAGITSLFTLLGADELSPHVVVLHGESLRLCQTLGIHPVSDQSESVPESVITQKRISVVEQDEPIAVIGLAGRYPDANNLDAFWRNLIGGVDSISEIPLDRWDHRAYFDATGETPGSSWSRWGGFIDGVDQFDPLFFHISPREARAMDPQERLFVETSFAALEDAGLSREAVAGKRVGVFAGVMWSQYQLYGLPAAQQKSTIVPMAFNASVANRVSHIFDFRGPSLSLDTACSSSLTALHLAMESLRNGTSDLALAGGVNLTLHPLKYQFLSQGRMLSSDGRCRAFGEGGDGYVPGEGVGVAVLKRLSQAQADGDPIWGVILASGISHGGHTAGYTVPSASRQTELIAEVIERSGVAPERITYVEAHGTGTSLGDPIEVAGLKGAFGSKSAQPWCALGSVKSNIGHLESASGIAGLSKVLLQMRYGQLAPSLHSSQINTVLGIQGSPFVVQRTAEEWRDKDGSRIAGLSSFGAGGANAHLIISQAPVRPEISKQITGPEVIVLSARTQTALLSRARDLLAWLDQTSPVSSATPTTPSAQSKVLNILLAAVAQVLCVDISALDIEEDLVELGLVSDRLESLRAILQIQLDIPFPQSLFATNRNIAALALTLTLTHQASSSLASESSVSYIDLSALAHTLQVGRSSMAQRLAFVASDIEDLRNGLKRFLSGQEIALTGPQHLRELATRFQSGQQVDWAAQRALPHPVRLGFLPTYPFEHESYWVTPTPFMGSMQAPVPFGDRLEPGASNSERVSCDDLADCLFIPGWVRDALPTEKFKHESVTVWVVSGAEHQSIAHRLLSSIAGSQSMTWAEAIERLSHDISPDEMWLLPESQEPLATLHNLMRALVKVARDQAIQIRLVSFQAYAVLPDDRLDIMQASLSAYLRSALAEMTQAQSVFVDLGANCDAAVLLNEICAVRPLDIAWRGEIRFIRKLYPVSAAAISDHFPDQARILITGGAGRVGLSLTAELIQRFGARIALVGRRADNMDIRRALTAIGRSESDIFYVSADVATEDGAKLAITRAIDQLGGVDYVIHAAAVYEEHLLEDLSEQVIDATFEAKTKALDVLSTALLQYQIKGLILFSSAQVYAGNVGRAHYAAACAASDAMAWTLSLTAPWPVRVINWGFWDTQDRVIADPNGQIGAQGVTPLIASDGARLLARAMFGPAVQLAALRLDRAVWPFLGIDSDRPRTMLGQDDVSFFESVSHCTAVSNDLVSLVSCRTVFDQINRYGLFRVFNLIQERGLLKSSNQPQSLQRMLDALEVQPQYVRLFDAVMSHLVGAGWVIESSPSVYESVVKLESIQRPELASVAPEMVPSLTLIEKCLDSFIDIISGRVLATEVMFPNGLSTLVDDIYRGNPASDYFNHQVVQVVDAIVTEARERGIQKIRVLEVGSGSGGTSAAVLTLLDRLVHDIEVEYLFTDISVSFLQAGRQRFGANRTWLNFKRLDIELDPVEQGFARAGFDIVIASNVLHATSNISNTLNHVTSLLRPAGVLIANEAVSIEPFTTLTFGLLNGWWVAQDQDVRLKHGPLLSIDGWQAILAQNGFVKSRALPVPLIEPALNDMRVIVAESGGVLIVGQTTESQDALGFQKDANAEPLDSTKALSESAPFVLPSNSQHVLNGLSRRVVVEIAQALELRESEILPDSPFASLGVDSIMAVSIIRKLNESFNIELRSTDLFNYPNLNSLVSQIQKLLPAQSDPSVVLPSATRTGAPAQFRLHAEPPRRHDSHIQQPVAPSSENPDIQVAVVGMSGRFPDAENLDVFWNNINSGHDAVREIPVERWPLEGFFDKDPTAGLSTGKWGGFIPGIDGFDPSFFQMSPREADLTDPQHRLFLMEAIRALEDSGSTRASLSGSKLGIFVGCKGGDYHHNFGEADRNAHSFTGNASSILPARLAFYLDSKGPAISIDTACSSSFVALHLAAQSLRNGECEMAVAGAVALMATPHTFLMLSRAGMLSPTGRCSAFAQQADGFVPGEGVGVVILKRLDRAIADGNPIHGIIRASALNQDGRSSSITAPSAPSQTKLITELYDREGIDASSIGYYEAHGTGTKLGDPIEAAALADAFVGRVPKGWNCPLGSVKSMIGHTMEAAGMASLIKGLLMLRHRRLIASLHFSQQNEFIDFDSLPFNVLTQAEDWADPLHGQPRRIALSSFGFSGTNAHVVLEQAPQQIKLQQFAPPCYAFLVSGKTTASLDRRVSDLIQWLERHPDADLAEVSATLMLARDHYPHRVAVAGSSHSELIEALRGYVRSGAESVALSGVANARQEPALAELARQLIDQLKGALANPSDYRGKLLAAADLYTKGYDLDFRSLFDHYPIQFVSLPTYPFDTRRCWIDLKPKSFSVRTEQAGGLLGSIDARSSLGSGLTFCSLIDMNHWVFAEHRVHGQRILPGTAYLAIALEVANRVWLTSRVVIENIRWSRTLSGEGVVEILTTLKEGGLLTISTHAGVHMQCRISQGPDHAAPIRDVKRLSESDEIYTIDCETLYGRFEQSGLSFGPRFKRIDKVSGYADVTLSHIQAHVDSSLSGFDTGLLDAMFQTIGGRLPDARMVERQAVMPVSVERIEVFGVPTRQAYVVAYLDGEDLFSVDMTDQNGSVVLRATGLAFIDVPAGATDIDQSQAPSTAQDAIDMYAPRWEVQSIASTGVSDSAQRVGIFGGLRAPALIDALRDHYPQAVMLDEDFNPEHFDQLLYLNSLDYLVDDTLPSPEVIKDYQRSVLMPLFEIIKKIGVHSIKLKVLTHRAHAFSSSQSAQPLGSMILGFVKAAGREILSLSISGIDIDRNDNATIVAKGVLDEPEHRQAQDVLLRAGARYVRTLSCVEFGDQASRFKEKGVYLIVGGAGGIGIELSLYLAKSYRANIVWVGRRPEDDRVRAAMQRVRENGAQVLYISADVTDASQLTAAMSACRAQFGSIHGVIHSALVLRDGLISKMESADLLAALLPKTEGIAALAQCLRNEPLDFFCVFSSAISFAGNPGQSNYSAASLFIDAYTAQLRHHLPYPVLTLNWGYWGEVGVVADDATRARMHAQGILSISSASGMQSFEQIHGSGIAQAMPMRLSARKRADMADEFFVMRKVPVAVPAIVPNAKYPDLTSVSEFDQDFFDYLDSYARSRVAHLLAFALPAVGNVIGATALREALAISEKNHLLFASLLDMLERDQYISMTGDAVRVFKLAEMPIPTTTLTQSPYFPLLDACLNDLLGVLTGRRDAAQVLFPQGSRDLVKNVYAKNEIMAACDRMLGSLVGDYLEQRRKQGLSGTVRILEVGSGTGAATRQILAALGRSPLDITYTFTDVSRSFVTRGESEFAQMHPFMRFDCLDIAHHPVDQGIETGSYDLVIASNVLHVVKHLGVALGHAKSLLKEGGLLLINEVAQARDFITLTFGLTPEWWSHQGEDGRLPHSPLLSGRGWSDRLFAEGFSEVKEFGPLEIEGHAKPQVIVAAVSDGWIRLPVYTALSQTEIPKVEPSLLHNQDEYALEFVREVFSSVLRMQNEELDSDLTFEMFGVDSLLVMDLTRAFEAKLGSIPATILYEARTMRALASRLSAQIAGYQAQRHAASQTRIAQPALVLAASRTSSKVNNVAVVQRADEGVSTRIEPVAAGLIGPATEDAVAVIGIACRFPGADDTNAFWSLLNAGRSAITEASAERWGWSEVEKGTRSSGSRHYSCWGGFINGFDEFDPIFFGISPAEAETMDPQERLFLQTAWHVLEDAGYPPPSLKGGAVGVYVGAMNPDYEWLSGYAAHSGHSGDAHSAYWSIANRVSYVLDLRGPSIAVDTACSSSSSAIHLACEAVRHGECDTAIAGGVNIIAGPIHYSRLCGLGMLSDGPDCKSFGINADGFVDGEGVGAVLLKPLSKALEDGDDIYGVIRGSAVTSGGKTSGYTVPNPEAQTQAINRALLRAGVSPLELSYIEAHGTGTALGDPIEFVALNHALGMSGKLIQDCALGSVKSNIGHLESAAGVAALIKVLLMLRHRTLVPTLHADRPNSALALENSRLKLQLKSRPWVSSGHLFAGVSSFGAGGTNVHIVVEQPPQRLAETKLLDQYLMVLSADDVEQLKVQATVLATYLKQCTDDMQEKILDIVSDLLGVSAEQIDKTLPLVDCGIDGSMALRFSSAIEKSLDLNLLIDPQSSLNDIFAAVGVQSASKLTAASLAYTLQTGRAQLSERFAVMVKDIPGLVQSLDDFVTHGMTHEVNGSGEWAAAGRDYLLGKSIDFKALWKGEFPLRASLPQYVFRRERYWIAELDQPVVRQQLSVSSVQISPIQVTQVTQTTQLTENEGSQAFSGKSASVLKFPLKSKGARVAIMGGGPAGLVTAKTMLEAGHEPVVFEKTDRIGGIWAQRSHKPYGTYGSTRLQSSKYTALFSDFPAADSMSVFPGAAELGTYFKDYVENFNLEKCLRLSTAFTELQKDDEGWRVQSSGPSGHTEEHFDAVAICPGLFWNAAKPDPSFYGKFKGTVLHSTDYFDASPFSGMRVLVVGNGVSGMDIAAEVADVARSVAISVRTNKWSIPRMIGFVPNDCSVTPLRQMQRQQQSVQEQVKGWRDAMPDYMAAFERSGLMPDVQVKGLINVNDRLIDLVCAQKVQVVPQVASFERNGAVFIDGRQQDFDVIIFCTGYKLPHIPFLGCSPADLYKNHFHPSHKSLAVIGMYPTTLGCFSTMELGARWFAQVLSNKVALPDSTVMQQSVMQNQRIHPRSTDASASYVLPIDTAVDNIWLAEQIGAFPDPASNWKLYWELINSPPIPAIYRLCGPNAWEGARAYLEHVKSKLFVNVDDADQSWIADDMLCALGADAVVALERERQIGQAQRDRVLGMIKVVPVGGLL